MFNYDINICNFDRICANNLRTQRVFTPYFHMRYCKNIRYLRMVTACHEGEQLLGIAGGHTRERVYRKSDLLT